MHNKNLILLAVAVIAVAAIYFYLYRDSFAKPGIQISHTIRPRPAALMRRAANAANDETEEVITFAMNQNLRLTSLKVVSVPELETNKFAHAVWDMASDSNSAPVRVFSYGMHIRGMHPVVNGAHAEALAPNVTYRLLVQAGTIKGAHDFTISDATHLAQ